ncbi:hypothetical protein AAHH67_06740 [Niallia circulans]
MAELGNCPNCGDIYVINNIRDVCLKCYKQEEADYEKVYQYIRKKQNCTAQMDDVVEATGVERTLIYKFIKKAESSLPNSLILDIPVPSVERLFEKGSCVILVYQEYRMI